MYFYANRKRQHLNDFGDYGVVASIAVSEAFCGIDVRFHRDVFNWKCIKIEL